MTKIQLYIHIINPKYEPRKIKCNCILVFKKGNRKKQSKYIILYYSIFQLTVRIQIEHIFSHNINDFEIKMYCGIFSIDTVIYTRCPKKKRNLNVTSKSHNSVKIQYF